MAGATRSIVIDAPVEKVFAVIRDYERYPEFLPEVKRIRLENRKGNEVDAHYEVDVVKTIKYSIRLVEDPPGGVRWTFLSGELMRDNRGSWSLEPLPDGKTRATYQIEMALGPWVPKSIVHALVDTQLPKMLEAFKKRAESLK